MKRSLQMILLFLIVFGILSACNSETHQTKGEKTLISEPTKNEKEELSSSSTEYAMKQIEKAVENNDIELFMSYQNKENPLFYKEQRRWIEEAIFKKEQGYKVSVDLSNFTKVDETTGMVMFKVTMSSTETSSNLVNYQMIKAGDKWLLNDLPFETLTSDSGNITIYYLKGQEDPAKKTLLDASDIVDFYSTMFEWKPDPISIKIYPTNKEVSATVPWFMLGGWNEMGESLKLTTDSISLVFKYLAHELTHKMVSDMTNDNATIYIQEGFATYLGATVTRGGDGKVSYDPQKAKENSKRAIEISNSIKTIEELGKIDYTDPEGSMYRDGALLSTFLIETKGMDSFIEMLKYLKKFEYIDKRSEHKMATVHERTVEAIEKVYGPAGQVSADVKKYFIK